MNSHEIYPSHQAREILEQQHTVGYPMRKIYDSVCRGSMELTGALISSASDFDYLLMCERQSEAILQNDFTDYYFIETMEGPVKHCPLPTLVSQDAWRLTLRIVELVNPANGNRHLQIGRIVTQAFWVIADKAERDTQRARFLPIGRVRRITEIKEMSC